MGGLQRCPTPGRFRHEPGTYSVSGFLEGVLDQSLEGQRLDRALAIHFPDYTRSFLQQLIREGRVRVDGREVAPRTPVRGGEAVRIELPEVEVDPRRAQPVPVDVVHADSHLLVVNKPAGLVVHPGAGNPDGTLLNGLLNIDPGLFALPRAGIVHRLDKDTSGLMVVARNETTRQALIEALSAHRVRRVYQAVVQGVLITGGRVDAPIGRHPGNRLKMAVSGRGKPAVSHYRVIARFRGHTHLEVRLETGRTHQIRVHMAHLGHPLLGDPLYGGRPRLPAGLGETARAAVAAFGRQALHAAELSFDHPASGEPLHFQVPLAADIETLLEVLAADCEQA